MMAMRGHPVGSCKVGGTACSGSWAREAASALIPLLILGSMATEAFAGPAVLSDAQMDAITAASSGHQQHWLAAGDRPMVEALEDAVRARATALQDTRTAVQDIRSSAKVSVDTAGARDAATAAVRGATAAAADLRAATGQAAQVPAAVSAATAGLAAPVATAVRDSVLVARSTHATGPEIRGAVGASDTAALRDAAKAVARATEAAASAVRATAPQESRAPVSVSVDKAAVRDAATAVARGTEAAVSALRAAEHRVPADLGSGTVRASQSVTSVTHSNGTVVKATAKASASGTDRAITKTAIRVSLKN